MIAFWDDPKSGYYYDKNKPCPSLNMHGDIKILVAAQFCDTIKAVKLYKHV